MKIYLKTFGCRVNQVEGQAIKEEYERLGCQITEDFLCADVCLVNACALTQNAAKEAEKLLSKINQNLAAKIILTGCLAAVNAGEIKQKHPNVRIIKKDDVAKELFNQNFDWTVEKHYGHSRAFVKIQDGCDNYCSYCIVPYARPLKVSKSSVLAVNEIKKLTGNGYLEIVLAGINVGNYLCPDTGKDLADLLNDIFKISGYFRIRLSSIEINAITDKLLSALKNRKAAKYLHIPLQSGSDAVLRDMRRKYTCEQYFKRIQAIRAQIPDIGIFCDVIAGYPLETERYFKESADFIKRIGFASLHVFSYSPRAGTAAAKMPPLAPAIIKARSKELHNIDKELRIAFAKKQIGSRREMLCEEFRDGALSGVLSNFQRAVIPAAAAGFAKQKGLIEVNIEGAQDDICIASLARYETLTTI